MKNILIKIKNLIKDPLTQTVIIISVIVLSSSFLYFRFNNFKKEQVSNDETQQTGEDNMDENCDVPIYRINGELVEYKSDATDVWTDETVSDDVINYLDYLSGNSDAKGLIIEINSTGGDPVGGQEIANALKRMKIPTVALIKREGLSSSYWLATGASHIIASNISDVGSIGITMSYLSSVKKNEMEGSEFVSLSSGKYKDSGNFDKAITEDEKAMFMKSVMENYNVFVDEVSANRKLDRIKVAKMADGSTMLGAEALKAGLIDEIGDMFSAKEYLSKQIGKKITTCFVN